MFCPTCGASVTPGLSFCNRCGANLKERTETSSATISAYLTAVTVIALGGLGLMLGGAIALRNGAHFGEEIVGIFMVMVFLIVGVVELLLGWQLSKLNSNAQKNKRLPQPLEPTSFPEFRGPQASLVEPVSSVTENTTRTLEYSRNEPPR